MSTLDLRSYLGPARLVRDESGELVVALERAATEGRVVVRATLAIPYPYRPALGDQLLVVGDEVAFFVIGVLHGRGTTAIEGEHIALRAEGGSLRLRGDRGVTLETSHLNVGSEALQTMAVRAVHTFEDKSRRVRETLRTSAGEVDEVGEGRWLLQAKQFVLKTLKNARIKSTTVRVG